MPVLPVGPEYSYVVVYRSQRRTNQPLEQLYKSATETLMRMFGPVDEQGFFLTNDTFVDLKANDERTTITVRFVTTRLLDVIDFINAGQIAPIHIILRKTAGGIEKILAVPAFESAVVTYT